MKNAVIYFLKPEEGGLESLPESTIYYATTGIASRIWNIVICFERPLEALEYTAPCRVAFIVSDVSDYRIDEISELSVYEGSQKVGRIVIDTQQSYE